MKFDEKSHTYYDEKDEVIPSVTQVLPGPDEDVMLRPGFWEKTELGTRVHKACDVINKKGGLKPYHYKKFGLQDKDIPYIDAWVDFLDENNVTILHSEMKVRSRKYNYAGTLDALVEENGDKSILDIKTVVELSPVTALQLAGYLIAYEEMTNKKIYRRQVVQLKPDGKYRRKWYEVKKLKYDKMVFLSKLVSYRWDVKHKLIPDIGGDIPWL